MIPVQNSSNAGDTTKRLTSESAKQEEDIRSAVQKNKQQVCTHCRVAQALGATKTFGFPCFKESFSSAQVLDTILGYVTTVKFQKQ